MLEVWTVEDSLRSNEGGLGGLTLVILGGGGGWTLGGGMEATGSLEVDIEGPVSGVASPGSMASSTTGPTTSLSRPPSLLPFAIHGFNTKHSPVLRWTNSRSLQALSFSCLNPL